ncbi:alpha-amylase family glycosyl hydrolase [Altererythrobacter sp. Z27]|uniref:alpha-amylase family glycosyl hydrolase n=1 Tax=Altererythrobacter sp. Z27 TaxID=3461147 RepID=UPI0040449727
MMRKFFFSALGALALGACSNGGAGDYEPEPYVKLEHADWTRDAVIYQVNTRQFTREGTFKAAQAHLPRLAEMGVDIVWLMPIHPIGEVNRKGELGSPYSVRDYRAINPDLGTEADFRAFVEEAHRLGMRVILDWVANHSAWDNPLTSEHPDWYMRNPEGEMMPPLGTDWSDVVTFDYDQPGLREYMTESLAYWVREFDIDGYRADVAGYVPVDFWDTARAKLDAIKPVFMLAEWESRDLHARAFDATYGWSWKNAMQRSAKDGGAGAIRAYYGEQQSAWPMAAYRMVYTDNHDQNAWDGVASEIYGDAYEAAIALSFVGSGIPLIYNGQEADLDHRLEFFTKDEIAWRDGRHADLFTKLIALKTEEKALWNGKFGAAMVEVPNSASANVYSFVRGGKGERVFAVFNLSREPQDVAFSLERHTGNYIDALSGEGASFGAGDGLKLGPWGYRIFREAD